MSTSATSFIFLLLCIALLVHGGAFPSVNDYGDLYTPAEIKRNVQRKALGLAPVKPKAALHTHSSAPPDIREFRQRKNRQQSPFFVHSRLSAGYIAAHKESLDGPAMGYLDVNGGLITNIREAPRYAYATSDDNLIELTIVDTDKRLCISTGMFSQSLSIGSKSFHIPRDTTKHTRAGEISTHDSTTGDLLQTTVFSVDEETGEIGAHWMNPDKTYPAIHIVSTKGMVYFTGDLDAFSAFAGSDVRKVVLKWITSM